MLKILVTDGAYANALAAVRELGSAGHEVWTLAFKSQSLCSFSKFCHGEIIMGPYQNILAKEQFLSILKTHAFDLVMPISAASVSFLTAIKTELPLNTQRILPVPDALDITISREKLMALAHSVGFKVPVSFFPKNHADIEAISQQLSFPCVVKSALESSGKIPVHRFNNSESFKYFFTDIQNMSAWMAQPFIQGKGVGFFAIYNQGVCGPTFQHQRLREFPVTGGISTAAEAIQDERLLNAGKALLDALNWNGVAMVEFKDTGKDLILMEINPKFWGSLDLSLFCGVSFPLALVDQALEKPQPFSTLYELKRFHWPLLELKHLRKNPRAFWSILKDCFSKNVGSNLYLKKDTALIKHMLHRLGLFRRG